MTAAGPNRWRERAVLGGLLLLGAGFYFWPVLHEPGLAFSPAPRGYYGLLTAGFRAGHLSVALDPPAGLLALPDPYDPVANAPYRAHDMSFFRGKYYLYFGPAPVLVFYWPVAAVLRRYPTDFLAVGFFLYGALAVGALLLADLRRRYFPAASFAILAAAVAVLGWATPAVFLTQAVQFYQVPIACAYFLGLVLLATIHLALVSARRARGWLAVASLAYGLAVAARPDYLLAGAALVVALAGRLRQGRPAGSRPVGGAAGLVGAAVLPAAACGAALLWYNFARFGSVMEFGMRYQLAGERFLTLQPLALANIGPHLATYLFGPGQWSPYFPFFDAAGESLPGQFRAVPWVWLGLLPLFAGAAFWRPRRGAAWLLAAIAAAGWGNVLLLCAFFGTTRRYPPDFMGPFLLLGGAGALLAGERWRRPAERRAVAWAGAGAAAVSLLLTAAVFARAWPQRGPLLALARVANGPTYLWSRLRGREHGPWHLELRVADQPPGFTEPLLETGAAPGERDWLQLEHLGGGRARLGFFHAGTGTLAGEPFALDPARPLQVDVTCGSLLPPYGFPIYGDLDARAYGELARTLAVRVDGRLVLAGSVATYPATPGQVTPGKTRWASSLSSRHFTGTIVASRRQPLVLPPPSPPGLPGRGPVELAVRFPFAARSEPEPLVRLGRGRASDLLYVIYTGGYRLRFALDHFGAGGPESAEIAFDPAREQRLVLGLGGLADPGPGAEAGAGGPRRLVLVADGRVLFNSEQTFYPADPAEVLLGQNPGPTTAAGPDFSGVVRLVRPVPWAELPAPPARGVFGAVDLTVQFPAQASAAGDPLVVTGRTGAGDFVYARYPDPGHVVFGYDHWGSGGATSPPVALDRGRPHRVRVTMPSLFAPGSPGAGRAQVEITVDGERVLAVPAATFPATADEIHVLQNPLGGSSCRATFSGVGQAVGRGDPSGAAP